MKDVHEQFLKHENCRELKIMNESFRNIESKSKNKNYMNFQIKKYLFRTIENYFKLNMEFYKFVNVYRETWIQVSNLKKNFNQKVIFLRTFSKYIQNMHMDALFIRLCMGLKIHLKIILK